MIIKKPCLFKDKAVGVARFELTIFWSQTRRDTGPLIDKILFCDPGWIINKSDSRRQFSHFHSRLVEAPGRKHLFRTERIYIV